MSVRVFVAKNVRLLVARFFEPVDALSTGSLLQPHRRLSLSSLERDLGRVRDIMASIHA